MSDTRTAAQRLRGQMTACRVHFTWLGLRRTLTPEQKARAADAFQASGRFLSAGKKLLDTGHPVGPQGHRRQIRRPEVLARRHGAVPRSRRAADPAAPRRRLRRDDGGVQATTSPTPSRKLDAAMPELKAAARARLGDLFSDGDYPERLGGLFAVEWDFPSVEPPAYLQDLAPEVYEEERRRVQERFEEAVRLTEEAFIAEFGKIVGRLVERLGEPAPGEPKRVFRDSAVENLSEFFSRFKELSVRDNDELDRLVERAKDAVRGVGPQDLRDSGALRQRIVHDLGQVQQSLDALMVERPRRRILRPSADDGGGLMTAIVVDAGGGVKTIYSEALPLGVLGMAFDSPCQPRRTRPPRALVGRSRSRRRPQPRSLRTSI